MKVTFVQPPVTPLYPAWYRLPSSRAVVLATSPRGGITIAPGHGHLPGIESGYIHPDRSVQTWEQAGYVRLTEPFTLEVTP